MKLLNRVLCWTLSLAMTAAALSGSIALAEEQSLPPAARAQEQEERQILGTVTGFGELENSTITIMERRSVGELLAQMPETLGVYLDGSTELTQIPVSWYCPGGYEGSNDFYFQFSPAWDEDSYPLMEGVDVEQDAPYVAVYLADPSAVTSLPTPDPTKRAVAPGSADEIFAFLTSEMGMNSAGACGILANMHAESALNPRSSCKDINGKTSYGLCQWNGSRFTRLKDWCGEYGEDYTTVTGQLRFLNYELSNAYPKVYNHLLSVEDTEEGAYDAAHYWCYYYEMPASKGKRSKERGNLARNSYWPNYGGAEVELNQSDTPVLTGVTTPEITVIQGEPFHLAGSIQCGKPLTEVSVEVLDAQGERATGVTQQPNSRFFAVSAVDREVKFSKLPSGDYRYRIQVKCDGQDYTLLEHAFTVGRKKLSEDSVTLSGGMDALPDVEVKDGEKTLEEGTDYRVSFKSGDESGTGLCVVIGKGNYAGKVKKPFQTALDLGDAEEEEKEQMQAEAGAPVLSDASLPGEELPQGNFITVRGIITHSAGLTGVAAQVLRADGSVATGGTDEGEWQRYDLNRLDKQVGFSKLSAGAYTYEIRAQAGEQSYTLLRYPFVVTPKQPTGVKLKRGAGALTVSWRASEGAEGYEVQYARRADFSDAQTGTVTGEQEKKLTGLEKKAQYYVRVCSYVTGADGALCYSDYSRTARAKTK